MQRSLRVVESASAVPASAAATAAIPGTPIATAAILTAAAGLA
jgi:hypothetical protein